MRHFHKVRCAVVTSFLVCLGGCGSTQGRADQQKAGGTKAGSGTDGTIDNVPPPAGPCAKMDLVFVVDNSGSMSEEQSNLAANFPKFISLLDNFVTSAGAQLDYRVAITTTGRDLSYSVITPGNILPPIPINEIGQNGAFQTGAQCNFPSGRRWLQRTDPSAANIFSCVAQVGTDGPSLEMPLYALELAFNERVKDGTNAGFLREDALLAVVILTDEDDCSRKDNNFTNSPDVNGDSACQEPSVDKVSEYAAFLDTLKTVHGRWAVSVIADPGPGECKSSFGEAAEAKRLKSFVELAAPAGKMSSICAGDLTGALKEALANFNAACEALPPIK